jgi:hypothetical protein
MYSNSITHTRGGSRLAFALVSTLPTLTKAALFGLTAIALVALGPRTASAANILWVSDTSPLGFSGPGNNNITDAGFIRLLESAGHNVMRWNSPDSQNTRLSVAELTAVNTNDLIIMGRAGASGQHQFPQSVDWNAGITKPLICMSPYFIRLDGGRLGWFGGGNGVLPDTTPTVLTAGDPNNAAVDFLFGGVPMNGANTVDKYDELLDRNTSLIRNAPVAGAVVYSTATFVQEDTGASGSANTIVGFPAGTIVSTNTPLAGYRMFFGGGSREGATFPNPIPLYTGRETLTPVGETVFLRAVQLAINNGIPPVTDPLAPVAVTTQPVSATVPRGGSVTFSVAISGAGPRTLQWQRDIGDGTTFTNIPGASTPFSMSKLTLSGVSAADDNAKFRVEASNPINTVVSDVATLTIAADTTAPVPLSAVSLDGSSIIVQFSELVDPRPLADGGQTLEPFNYILTDAGGAGVSSVTLRPDGRSVILGVNATVSPAFSINIALVEDLYGNAIDAAGVDVAGISLGLTAVEVGAVNPAGGSFAPDANTIVVGGGGLDIQATTEQFRYVYKSVAGDFEARVRVQSITGSNRFESVAKAILSARAATDGGAMCVDAFVTPPYPSDTSYGSTARTTTGGATSSNFVAVPYVPFAIRATFPAWLRVKRAGDNFTTYGSANGSDWTQIGSISVAMGTSALVGLGVNSHRNGQIATATFSDFAIIQAPNRPTITGLSYTAGTFSGSFQTQAGFNYVVRYKDDLNAASWQVLTTIPGDGTVKSFTDAGPAGTQRFYSLLVQ